MLTGYTRVVAKPGMGKELLSMAATMPGGTCFQLACDVGAGGSPRFSLCHHIPLFLGLQQSNGLGRAYKEMPGMPIAVGVTPRSLACFN